MIKITSKDQCCGCFSCVNICQQKAIIMVEDEKGFKYPIVDKEKCIKCNACQKVCPILKQDEKKANRFALKTFACVNKNTEERIKSSSGGIFILLAKEIINKGGVVFGARFDDEFNVVHSYAKTIEELTQFMESKYTQSKIGNTFELVKDFLERETFVLFTGTPCQIEGLKAYLKKDYEKLYTQDIVCHGVPSPKVWQKYLDYLRNNYKEEIRKVSFRNKDKGWEQFQIKISFNSKTYYGSKKEDPFMQAFLKNICLRDSCYKCHFKKIKRESDITLGDFWGIDKILPKFNDNQGTSLVMINSIKGKKIFDSIKEKIIYKEVDINRAVKFNSAITQSVNHSINENKYIKRVSKMNFKKLTEKYVPYYPTSPFYRKIINRIKIKFQSQREEK